LSSSDPQALAVFGASSLVGRHLLGFLLDRGFAVHAFSRHAKPSDPLGVVWHSYSENSFARLPKHCFCVSLMPVWRLKMYLPQIFAVGVVRVVALSSMSLFSKEDSMDPKERRLSDKIALAEKNLKEWAHANNVELVILRPTLVYGSGMDKNISILSSFIRRFRFFPLYGKADGLRQPLHARDVAQACLCALQLQGVKVAEFNLSGAETLTYKEMVMRVFLAMGLSPRLIKLPGFVFRSMLFVLKFFPKFRHWSHGMVLRMNQDQSCDHFEAATILGFSPQPFILEQSDLPALSKHQS
jgi:nucleoside-diphosphate-sugar epimerase